METPTDNELLVDRQEPLEGSPADKPQELASSSTDNSSQAHQSPPKHDAQGQARRSGSSYRPPSLKRLMAGMGASVATGVVLGKLVRGPWSDQVDTFDDRLLDATRKAESRALDPIMAFFSNMGEPQALYSLSGLLAAFWIAKRTPVKSLTLGLTLVGSVAIDQAIKSTVKRPRPYLKLPLPRSRPSGSSFPSSHAASSIAAYGAMFALLRGEPASKKTGTGTGDANREQGRKPSLRSRVIRTGLPALLCGLIGWSRVYRGVHNPSDVLGGWLVGGIWLAACTPKHKQAGGTR